MIEKILDLIENIFARVGVFFGIILISPILAILSLVPIAYPIAIYKWLNTEHIYFWEGFKELLFALWPLLNIVYCWDYIKIIFEYILMYAVVIYGLLIYFIYQIINFYN